MVTGSATVRTPELICTSGWKDIRQSDGGDLLHVLAALSPTPASVPCADTTRRMGRGRGLPSYRKSRLCSLLVRYFRPLAECGEVSDAVQCPVWGRCPADARGSTAGGPALAGGGSLGSVICNLPETSPVPAPLGRPLPLKLFCTRVPPGRPAAPLPASAVIPILLCI